MCDLSTELIIKIDGFIRNNPKDFAEAAKALKHKFSQLEKANHSFPIFHTLSSTAKKICKEQFNNDFETASLILLIAWMTNKKDADLDLLGMPEFSTWESEDMDWTGRSYAGALIAEHKNWAEIVNRALSIAESELCSVDSKQHGDNDQTLWDRMIRWVKNNPVLVVVGIFIVLLGLVATVKTNWEKVFPPQDKRAGQLKRVTPDKFEKLLAEHRDAQIGRLLGLVETLKSAITDEINDVCEKLANKEYSQENHQKLAKAVSLGVASVLEPYFGNIGTSKGMEGFAPPTMKPEYKAYTLSDWVEHHESGQKFVMALITFLEEMFNKEDKTFFNILEIPQEHRSRIVEQTLKDLLTSPMTKKEVLRETDKKLMKVYREEYYSR